MDWEDGIYEVPVPPDVNDCHILVIDEDHTFSRTVTTILRDVSYQVTEIQIPEIVLSMIQQQPQLFDLVLLGIPLQAIDSIKFLADVLAVNEDMPVIFMSSKPDLKLTLTALQFGATLVLDKPIKKHIFLSLWQHVIRKRSLGEKQKEREDVDLGSNFANVFLQALAKRKHEALCDDMKLRSTVRQIRIALSGKNQHSEEQNIRHTASKETPNLVMRQSCALGSGSGLSMGGNVTCFPRINVSGRTQGPSNVMDSVNTEVLNAGADEESSSSDETMDDEFTLEALFPELKNGDGAGGNA